MKDNPMIAIYMDPGRIIWKATDNVSAILVGLEKHGMDQPLHSMTDALKEVFLFDGMTQQELLVIAPYLEEAVIDRGEVIVSEGDPASTFYIVVSGRVRISRGAMRLVDLKAGQHFGELALTRPVKRSATVKTLTPTRLYSLTRARFHDIVRNKPELGARLALRLLDALGDRVRDLSDRLEEIQRVTANSEIDAAE